MDLCQVFSTCKFERVSHQVFSGIASALASQIALLPEDHEHPDELFPRDARDINGQQVRYQHELELRHFSSHLLTNRND